MRIFGESIDPAKAETYDMDKDYAAVRRDRLADDEKKKTTSLAQATTSEAKSSETTSATKTTEEPETTTSSTSSTSLAAQSSDVGEGKIEYKNDHFGAYFMAVALIGFIIVVLVMRYHRTPGGSRRRRRRDEYEFDIIPGEDYSDSEEETDSLDLGERNDRPRGSEEARDRLFDELHAETLPDYEEEMFRIVDDDHEEGEGDSKKSQKDKGESQSTEVGAAPSSQSTET